MTIALILTLWTAIAFIFGIALGKIIHTADHPTDSHPTNKCGGNLSDRNRSVGSGSFIHNGGK